VAQHTGVGSEPAGPFDRWPTGLGFEYFYGFLGAAVSQWEPVLYRNTTPVEPATGHNGIYHLTPDLVNNAIQWVQQHDAVTPQKPFFLYLATGATHSPHHVPQEWSRSRRALSTGAGMNSASRPLPVRRKSA
jgi:arylsulfatase A-like enzyme